ncbi:MAG: cyclic nucleotide-binding domain-containing protein [Deltaproteobacteria bacterium]
MTRAEMIAVAEAAFDRGDHDEAIRRYEDLERREPTDPTWPSRIAEVCRAKKDRPGRIQGLCRAALAFAQSGVPMKGIAMAKLALALDKNNPHTKAVIEALNSGELPAPAVPVADAPPPAEPESEDLQISVSILPPIALFSSLGPAAFEELLESSTLHELSAGKVVFEKGDAASSMYVVAEGEVEVLLEVDAPPVAKLGSGEFFGEMSLFARGKDGAKRGATVRTTMPSQLLELRLEVLTRLIQEDPSILSEVLRVFGERLIANVLRKAKPFDALLEDERAALGKRFHPTNVKKGASLISQGTTAAGLFILIHGEVEIRRNEEMVAELGSGSLFGEISVMTGLPATASVVASKKCLLLTLAADEFQTVARDFPALMKHAAKLASERMDDVPSP